MGWHVPRLAFLLCKERVVGSIPTRSTTIMVFPIQRRSTLQNGIGIQHPQPGPRENSDEAVKIGARRVLHHYQRYCVVPLRKELTISRIIDNPSEMMTNWVLPNNTEVLNLTFGVVAQQVEQ
jgi:hypothetical protein